MGRHRALGLAGRARGVELERVVLGVDPVGWRCRGKTVTPDAIVGAGAVGRIDADHLFDAGRLGAGGGQSVRKALADEHHARFAIVEDVGDLGRGEAPIDRGHHRANACRAEKGLEIKRVVLAEEGHAIARLHTQRGKAVRRPVRPLV